MNHQPAASTRKQPPVSRSIAALGLLLLGVTVAGLAAGTVILRTLPPPTDRSALRATLLKSLDIARTAEIEITVPAWATVLARFGATFTGIDTEVRTALKSLRSGQVGVYKLERTPERREMQALLRTADAGLERSGWTRTTTIFDQDKLVAIYLADTGGKNVKCLEGFMVVQDRQDLVIVSLQGRTAPLLELARTALAHGNLAAIRF